MTTETTPQQATCTHPNGTYAYSERLTRCWDCKADIPVTHDCWDHPNHYLLDNGRDCYDCALCGAFLQVG